MKNSINAFRRFNRYYTNHTGLLQRYLPGGETNLSEARILLEIGHEPGTTAADLGRRIAMDRGQLSRILKKMTKNQLVRKNGVPSGRKAIPLYLTETGEELLRHLEQAADEQARKLLAPLPPADRSRVITAMADLEKAFSPAPESSDPAPGIRESRPGDLGWVLMRHGQVYAQEYGFDTDFERYVLEGMLPYAEQADAPGNRLWIAEHRGKALGCVAIARDSKEEAQLRWFLVEPEARGYGLGKELLRTALEFCREQGFSRVFLLTIDILPAARHLYESFGFRVTESTPVRHWGRSFCDERWELQLTEG